MALKKGESLAVLTREFCVRVLNVSLGGCLIESDRPMAIGTVARLRLRLGMDEYVDDVEVLRCRSVEENARVFHVGMRFLWTMRRHARSIRHAVDCHVVELYASAENTPVM
jgi:hypothetical protein